MSELDGLTYVRPADIEARSFQIISDELGSLALSPEELLVVKRVVHTTADFDYAQTLHFTPHAVERGIAALASGATVVTDTTMVAAGINKRVLGSLGGEVRTFIGDAPWRGLPVSFRRGRWPTLRWSSAYRWALSTWWSQRS